MPDVVRNAGKHPFQYHKPTDEQAEVMALVTIEFASVYDAIMDGLPESRERSLAITKLQEARMWVNAAIVLNG